MQSEGFEVVAGPAVDLARPQVPTLALHHEAAKSVHDVAIQPVELACGIPGAEVVTPAAQDRVQLADQDPRVLHPVPVASSALLHALLHALHAALRRPPLEEVDATALPLPDEPAHALVQVAAEKVEALPSTAQVDLPRLVRVQLQSQPCEDRP